MQVDAVKAVCLAVAFGVAYELWSRTLSSGHTWVTLAAAQHYVAVLQVKKLFRRASIVGKRYPIVHVYEGHDKQLVTHEVSSFTTNTDAKSIPQDMCGLIVKKVNSACLIIKYLCIH